MMRGTSKVEKEQDSCEVEEKCWKFLIDFQILPQNWKVELRNLSSTLSLASCAFSSLARPPPSFSPYINFGGSRVLLTHHLSSVKTCYRILPSIFILHPFDTLTASLYNSPMHYDLCLPWYWEYDMDFVQMIECACREKGLTLWQITPDNLLESVTALYKGEISFHAIIDRSQYDPRFGPIHRWSREHHTLRINPAEVSRWSEDKATMHLELITAGIHTPHTVILPPFMEEPVIPAFDLAPLGNQFVIKPTNEGGSEGVILGASSMDQILRARMQFPEQKYLVQATIVPRTIHGRPAWFRVFYAVGKTYPCWWHPLTHVFSIVTAQDENKYELLPLRDITQRIASICRLDWFSTEIALTLEQFIVVDYVNDGIDTRVQSKAVDGVPDEVMRGITDQLIELVASRKP